MFIQGTVFFLEEYTLELNRDVTVGVHTYLTVVGSV